MPAVGFGLSLDGGVIIADFMLEGGDDVTLSSRLYCALMISNSLLVQLMHIKLY
jgi:hypothetical protein